MLRYIVFVLFVFVFSQTKASPELIRSWDGIYEYRLKNGMSILLAPDSDQKVIHADLVYLTGSLADPEGASGTAHFLEHMMFKGTTQRKGPQLLAGLQEQGIQFNATTSFDRTRYSARLNADYRKLDFLLELEAERMSAPVFSESDMNVEVEVIRQEIAKAKNDVVAMFSQQLLAEAWSGKGYGRSVLGSYDELQSVKLQDLRQFHTNYYHPNNAVLVLTGGFDLDQALSSVHDRFAKIKPSAHAIHSIKYIPSKNTESTIHVQQGGLNILALSYELPPSQDERNTALVALAEMLAGEPHGRLYQSLVVPGKAQSVFVIPQFFRQGGQVIIGAVLGQGQSPQVIQQEFIAQIERLREQPIPMEELARIQTMRRPLKNLILNDAASLSDVLSEAAAQGNWLLNFQRHDQVEKLTPVQLQVHVETLLADKKPVVGYLLALQEENSVSDNTKEPLSSDRSATSTKRHSGVSAGEKAAIELDMPDVEEFNAYIRTIENSILRDKLSNGMKVALRPLPDSKDLIRGHLNLRFGNPDTLKGTQAVSDLVGTLLIRGTHKRSYQELIDRVNQLGAGFHVMPKRGMLSVRFASPPGKVTEVLGLIAEVLKVPAFTEREFDLVKRQQMQALMTPVTQPVDIVNRALRRYTEQHYSQQDVRRHLEPKEMQQQLEKVTRETVQQFHRDYYGAQHGEVAISGNFDSEQIKEALEVLFGNWMSRSTYEPIVIMHNNHMPIRQSLKSSSNSGYYNGRIYFAANSKSVEDAELFIIEHVLGRHPLASRVSRRLREQEQLSYDIRSSIRVPTQGDYAFVSIRGDFSAGQGMRLADAVKEEVARIADFGISQYELDLAKSTILDSRRQTLNNEIKVLGLLSKQLAEGTTMESWIDRNNEYAGVTLDGVNEVASRYFKVDEMVEILAVPK
ncbi:zinc protease [Marinomonas alcarazii]|uniref:Zinc protease n=2 Tax=Marinomonas alcarazii TaxID=491949 RepID=A0A318UVZ7_9GAMM|nr:zinc protease [Marinomonas alcarazii]